MALKMNVTRRRIEAEENAVLDLQFAILDILRQEGITKEELARRLDVSKARISQLFAAGANPTVKQVARIFDALDREFCPASMPLQVESGPAKALWHQDRLMSHATEEEIVYGRVLDRMAANENYGEQRVAA